MTKEKNENQTNNNVWENKTSGSTQSRFAEVPQTLIKTRENTHD